MSDIGRVLDFFLNCPYHDQEHGEPGIKSVFFFGLLRFILHGGLTDPVSHTPLFCS